MHQSSREILKDCGCNGDHKIIQMTEPQVLLAIVLASILFAHLMLQKWKHENVRLGSSLGTTLRNATQAKRASQGFIGQAERTRGTK